MLFTAIAEAAATIAPEATAAATEAAATTTANPMSMFSTIFYLMGALFVYEGIASIVTGELKGGGRSFDAYTTASKKAFVLPYGISMLIFGISFILEEFLAQYIGMVPSYIIGVVLLVVGFIVIGINWKKLEKKPGAK